MPWFEYDALTVGGAVMAGRLEAETQDSAAAMLRDMQLDVRELHTAPAPRRPGSLSADDLVFFNDQLAAMADAGIALDEGLAELARDVESPRLRRWIDALVADLRRGLPLEQAIAAHEAHLPLLYSSVIRAGVRSGELPATLLNLNEHLRLAGRTRRIIWETISYPLLVSIFALLIVGLFLTFIVPQFAEIFADFETQLPVLTQAIITAGAAFPTAIGLLFAAFVALCLGWRMLRSTPRGRTFRESVVAAIPGIGPLHRASLIARFMRAVATSIASGLTLHEALRLGAGATGSVLVQADAERLAQTAESGEPIFPAARSGRVIPPLFGFCVQSARSHDALPIALGKLARSYELRAEHTQSMLRSLLTPMVIIVLGGFIGVCIAGIFLPLISLVNALTG